MRERKSDSENLPNYFSFGWMLVISLCITLCLNWPTMNSRFWDIFFQNWYHIACANTFATMLLMITFTTFFTSYLDSRFLWEEDFWKRFFFQIILGFIAPIIICYLFGWVSFYFLNVNISSTRYVRNMSSLLILICIMINLLHMVYYYIYKSSEWLNRKVPEIQQESHHYLLITEGKGKKKIAISTIAYIFAENKTAYIYYHDNKRDISFKTLDKLLKEIDNASFFRATRTCIVSSNSVKSYKRLPDRGLSVSLQPTNSEPVKVSREKASLFITWLESEVR